MGQAKALNRLDQERIQQEEAQRLRAIEEAEERARLAIERSKPARVYSPAWISSRNRSTLIMAALSIAAMSAAKTATHRKNVCRGGCQKQGANHD
jgi:predicted phage gp36 major capsid-like protein